MKAIYFPIFVLAFLCSTFSINAQSLDEADSTGLPGDQFDLAAALELFKKSSSPEDFENSINSEENGVNNLDINDDKNIDYLSVHEFTEGDAHAFVLRVAVNKDESQDIAVITLEKNGPESAQIQIVGDAEIFGDSVFVEPYDEKIQGGKSGPSEYSIVKIVFLNVWAWPCVRFVYRPAYRVWVSPYYWGFYPARWKPWRPNPWRIYRKRVKVYHSFYQFSPVLHLKVAHKVYKTHKVFSPFVVKKYAPAHVWHKKQKAGKNLNGGKQIAPNGKVKAPQKGSSNVNGGKKNSQQKIAPEKKSNYNKVKRNPPKTAPQANPHGGKRRK